MKLRAVSPLIATIILIALTVAIGAIIVGWARSYVSSQTSCLNAQMNILSAYYNSTPFPPVSGASYNVTQLIIEASNAGSTDLYTSQIEVVIYGTDGNKYICSWNGVTSPYCYLSWIEIGGYSSGVLNGVTATPNNNNYIINPGNITVIDVYFENLSSGNPLWNAALGGYVEIQYGSCGTISTREQIS